jgi:hypothetical protein
MALADARSGFRKRASIGRSVGDALTALLMRSARSSRESMRSVERDRADVANAGAAARGMKDVESIMPTDERDAESRVLNGSFSVVPLNLIRSHLGSPV